MKKTITLLISAALLMVMNVRGQTTFKISPDIISAAGGKGIFNTTYNVDWTLGETTIGLGNYNNDSTFITIGFHQGFADCFITPDTNWFYSDSCVLSWPDSLVPPQFDTIPPDANGIIWAITPCWTYDFQQIPHFFNSTWCVTVIEENESTSNSLVQVFPNPATESLTLLISENTNPNGTLHLFDINGRLLQQNSVTTNRYSLDIAELTPGIYLLRMVTTSGKLLSTHKIIKQ